MDAYGVDDLLDFTDTNNHHHTSNNDDDFLSAPNDTLDQSYNYGFHPPPTTDHCQPHIPSSPPPPPPPPLGSDFTDSLCSLPSADVAELEWLSKFVDDSFTDYHDEDGSSLILTSTTARAYNCDTQNQNASFVKSSNKPKPMFMRHRFTPTSTVTMTTSSNETDKSSSKSSKRNYSSSSSTRSSAGEISSSSSTRRCTHCASEKTPQWRTGPLGPKTLCNACGVRYKSGRLVPEYRPAASPTFVLTQHSNSHRKVLELRRQKEVGQEQGRVVFRQHDFEVC